MEGLVPEVDEAEMGKRDAQAGGIDRLLNFAVRFPIEVTINVGGRIGREVVPLAGDVGPFEPIPFNHLLISREDLGERNQVRVHRRRVIEGMEADDVHLGE